MKNPRVAQTTQKLLDMIESGNLPDYIARSVIQRKGGAIPSDYWSLGNRLLMLVHGTEDARGFRQWEQAGRKVKKGSRAFHILAPVTVKKPKDTEDGEEFYFVIVGFKAVPVFRSQDTEGEPLPDYTPEDCSLPPLLEVAEHFGLSVEYKPFTGDAYGSYGVNSRQIALMSEDAPVFFHELAHAVHGTFRELKGGQHAEQEIVAETVAAALSVLYGYEGYLQSSVDYIKHYSKQTDPLKAIMGVLSDVQSVMDLILQVEGRCKV